MEEEQPIDWEDPDIPIQFFAMRRELIRLSLLVEALMKGPTPPGLMKEIEQPGSELRLNAWKGILERHRQAVEPQN